MSKQSSELDQLKRALLALKEMRARLSDIESKQTEPIAIVGMGCRFPGGANSPEAFWRLLYDKVDAISEVPAGRWDVEALYDPDPGAPGKVSTRWGGFLAQVDRFDPIFFGISPREAEHMDPQQRLLLEVAWEALEDAGQTRDRLAGSQTGVFVGIHSQSSDYYWLQIVNPDMIDTYTGTGTAHNVVAGRLSYLLDLQGPSVAVDTACSSSLVAVHLGCQSLRAGECNLALVGGVNLILAPFFSIATSKMKMLAPDGRCRTFDAQASGFIRGEGCGVVVLKRLSDALVDGDNILALIRGSAINQDGYSNGLTAPNGLSQEAVIRQALVNANLNPSQISYVEAHGTGTPLGDPIEIEALKAVFDTGPEDHVCALGSAKANIGHLEGAAGIAGLIKVVLSLQHEAIPPLAHFTELNPHISLTNTPLVIPTKPRPWPSDGKGRHAGVSSFGWSGTNAHVVVTEAPPAAVAATVPATGKQSAYLLPLSAHTPEALATLAQSYKAMVLADKSPLYNIAYTASRRRTHHDYRLALVVENHEDAAEKLAASLQGEDSSALSSGQNQMGGHKVVFIFPGQGSQWLGMGRQLMAAEPLFRQALEACEQAMQPFVNWSLLQQLAFDETSPAYRLNEIDVIQPTLLSIEIALAQLWRAWGVEPDAVIGHSMGEAAAAYVAGALSLEDTMRVICRRSKLLRRTSGQGAMAAVELSIESAQKAIAGYEDRLSIAVSNSPRSTVLSGDPAALDEVVQALQNEDVFCRLIKVDVASHSPQMEPLKAELSVALADLQPRPAAVPIYSTAQAIVTDGAHFDAAYWVQNLRQPVLFAQMVQQLLVDGHHIFIEMSPHPILLPSVQQLMQHASVTGLTLPSLRRNEMEQATVLNALGALYTAGYTIDWDRLYPTPVRPVRLPPYPWQRERYWIEQATSHNFQVPGGRSQLTIRHPLLDRYLPSANGHYIWEIDLSAERFPYLLDHQVQGKVVVPAAAYVEMALAAAAEAFTEGVYNLENVAFKEALFLTAGDLYTLQLLVSPAMPGAYTCHFFGRSTGAVNQQAWRLHATGTLRQASTTATGQAEPRTRPPATVPPTGAATPGASHYKAMQQRGLAYGPAFQGVAHLWRPDESTVIGQLQLPDTVAADDRYRLHPALLDACFQLLAATATADSAPAATYLPVSLERVELHGRPDVSGHLWAYAARRPDDTMVAGDIYLLDETSQVLAVVRDFRLQRLVRDTQEQVGDWLYQVQWQPVPLAASQALEGPGQWLILADSSNLGPSLASQLEAAGESCVLVFPGADYQNGPPNHYRLDPGDPLSFKRLLQDAITEDRPFRGLIHLWSLDIEWADDVTQTAFARAEELGCVSTLYLIQALAQADLPNWPRLWLVTRGAQVAGAETAAVAVAQSPLWGMGSVITHEHPELRCTRIDLDPAPAAQESQALLAELGADEFEDQIALRPEGRYVARLVRYTANAAGDGTAQTPAFEPAPGQNYRLEIATPGILDNLVLRPAERRPPAAGEVEIEICATGLNFIDVLKAMGLYPGLDPRAPLALGGECAGRITAVGPGVSDWQIGNAVVALNPSPIETSLFSGYAILPVELVAHRPDHLSFAEAATLPVAFLTAYYALYYLGRLSQGERVLIHSATGGVGQAALQLAQLAGAEIFATAGSPEKRAYLRELGIEHVMDSRSLDFAAEVMARTDGKGVDVVLNSLAGEAIRQSLALLGPYGRFLEIGKRDIYQNSQIGLEPFKNNLTFFAIDLARVIVERPQLIASLFKEVMQLVADGALRPLPTETFPINQVGDAFRTMAQARHIGKIVVAHPSAEDKVTGLQDPKATSPHPATLSPDHFITSEATYLITGGLGGLGLVVADWLVQEGARHLVLAGRSAPSQAAQAAINSFARAGAQVVLARADVTQIDQMAAVMAQIESSMPPLRGVIHAAGLLADSTLLQMDRVRLEQPVAPKVYGAWNLHRLTAGKSLDFFVLFSSVATLLGSPGQANYAAGNAFLDALAHHRRAQGLPGLSINWGGWSEVGLAAAQANRGQRLAQRGLGSFTPAQGLEALAQLLSQTTVQAAVMPFDVGRWCDTYPAAASTSLLRHLLREQGDTLIAAGETRQIDVRTALLALDPGRPRRTFLETHLQAQVARVLRLSPSRVEVHKPLKSFGLDSLMAIELRNRLETTLGVTLSATLAFNYPTIAVMVPYIAEKLNVPLESDANGTGVAPTLADATAAVVDVAEIRQLSDEDAEALLLKELEDIEL